MSLDPSSCHSRQILKPRDSCSQLGHHSPRDLAAWGSWASPGWPYRAPGKQHKEQDAGAEPVPVHFYFPNVMFMVRWLNQARGVGKAFSHQWELWLRNGCTTSTSQFTWHSSTSGCLCMGCSCVLPAPRGPQTGKIPCVKVRCATLDFDGCRGWCGSMFIGCHTGVDAAVLRHQVADLQGELSWVTVDAGSPGYKTLLHLLMVFI